MLDDLNKISESGSEDNIPAEKLEWVDDYILSDEDADKIADPTWLIENLIIKGHLILLPAEPNGGKLLSCFILLELWPNKEIRSFM